MFCLVCSHPRCLPGNGSTTIVIQNGATTTTTTTGDAAGGVTAKIGNADAVADNAAANVGLPLGCVGEGGMCGGEDYTGVTCCVWGTVCTAVNRAESHCMNAQKGPPEGLL